MQTFREKLLFRITKVMKKAGLECIDDGLDDNGRQTVLIQQPGEFTTAFVFRLWKDDGDKRYHLHVMTVAAHNKTDDPGGKNFEFYPHDNKKIERVLKHLDALATKKVGVHQALAGAAQGEEEEVEDDESR